MKNFIQPGDSIDVIAPADVNSGAMVLIGSLLGVASNKVLSGASLSIGVTGVYEVPKLEANTWVVGNKVNYNTSTGEFQLATTTLDNAGTVVEAADNSKTVGKVRFTPV